MDDRILQEDLRYLGQSNIPIEELRNTTVLITGSTGMIGSQLVKTIIYCNRQKQTNIKVIAFARNEEKVKQVFSDYQNDSNLSFVYGEIEEKLEIEAEVDYIVHTASITSSKAFVEKPVETIKVAIDGTTNVLELARKKQIKAMVYLSSLEIYGITDFNQPEIKEDDYGYLDFLNVRSSYSESKRMVECLCSSYAKEYQVPVRIARLCQTFGAGVEYSDQRVFAEFARCILEKRDIVLHTTGETVRNYCYTRDAIAAIIYILSRGVNGDAYNVANEHTAISIKDMAQMLVKRYKDSDSNIVFDIGDGAAFGYNPLIKLKLNTDKLKELGWRAEVGLEEMYDRMIKSMQFTKEGNKNNEV